MLRVFARISGNKISGYHTHNSNRAVIGFVGLLLAAPSGAFAAKLYVSASSPNPQAPYSSWATAAQNIQDAVDAAHDGDTVLVNDGVYTSGGRAVPLPYNSVNVNRAAIDRAITVKSVNGPGVTVIDGANADRCVYLGNGALLSGFTLTRGLGIDGDAGGVWCAAGAVVTNCTLKDNYAGSDGGGAYGGTLYNCTFTNNISEFGGAALGATLYNCTMTGNFAKSGGGAYESTLYNCTMTGNGTEYGGGACYGTLYNCTLTDNSAELGGGAYGCILYNCTLKDNWAGSDGGGVEVSTLYNCTMTGNGYNGCYRGGGADGATLYNCVLAGNQAHTGGGANYSTLYNCTVVGNTAFYGGGVVECAVSNSIVYYNSAPVGPNYYDDLYLYPNSFDHSCTTPLPSSGVGNIAQEPGFVDLAGGNYRLQITSQCINAGLNQDRSVGATDLDGNPRISWGTVDMGAYEFLLPSSGPWKNHGQYVSAVAHVAAQFVARRLITVGQASAFVSAAAKSDIGKQK
jgi:hypothetical protein